MHCIPGVFMRRDAADGQAPVVFDIPRSGTVYPCQFRPSAGFADVHQSVSMYVEQLYWDVVQAGASWLYALFPNSFIDANRHEADIDPGLLDGSWPGKLETTEKSRLGIGLIHSTCGPTGVPLYDRKLGVADVRRRLNDYYLPYHSELADLLAARREAFGVAYHISCHSMASVGGASTLDRGSPRSDFDIGDRHGQTCEPEFTELVVSTLKSYGYRVTTNFHYAGAESVRRHAAPEAGIHSLQIEIKRGLFMDEESFARNDSFDTVRQHLSELAKVVAAHARSRAGAAAGARP